MGKLINLRDRKLKTKRKDSDGDTKTVAFLKSFENEAMRSMRLLDMTFFLSSDKDVCDVDGLKAVHDLLADLHNIHEEIIETGLNLTVKVFGDTASLMLTQLPVEEKERVEQHLEITARMWRKEGTK